MKSMFFSLCCCAAGVILLFSGCADPRITNTGRNAIEQMLLTTAVDRSAAKLDFRMLAKDKVRIDYSLLATQTDKNYVQAAVEASIAAAGAIIALKPEEAVYVLRPVCAVLATEDNKIVFGTPQLPVPIPDASLSIVIPELPLFKRIRRTGVCKLYVEVLDAKTNKQLKMVGPAVSQSVHSNWVICFIPFATRDFDMGDSGPATFHFFE
ncbi:MAG: hypothetical protein E7048_11095 [Lentisphaerae bacterium]|nr:hypothetical protein [Lentisphaerota bacterium]